MLSVMRWFSASLVLLLFVRGTLVCDDYAHILKTVNLVQFFAVDPGVNADAICVVGHQFGLLGTYFHAKG